MPHDQVHVDGDRHREADSEGGDRRQEPEDPCDSPAEFREGRQKLKKTRNMNRGLGRHPTEGGLYFPPPMNDKRRSGNQANEKKSGRRGRRMRSGL